MAEAPTIPADILAAAETALDNMLCNCRESLGSHEAVRKASIEEIAQAILAERERCVDACRRLGEHMRSRGQFQDAFTAEFIAQQFMDGSHV